MSSTILSGVRNMDYGVVLPNKNSLPSEIVVKCNDFIRSRLMIKNVLSGRILAVASSTVRIDDADFYTYSISVSHFFSDNNLSGDRYNQLKQSIKELSGGRLERKISKNNYAYYALFSKISYNNGFIEMSFHPDLKPFFIDLKVHFTQYNLMDFLSLPSTYSQRIFEILKSWANLPEIIITVDELQSILDVPTSFLRDFSNFRYRVLDKAYKDINEKTNLKYEWEAIKTKNKVTAIRFIFSQQNRMIAQKATIQKLTDKFISEQARPGETWEEARNRLSNKNQKLF